MQGIGLGALAFALSALVDPITLRGLRLVKVLVWVAAGVDSVFAVVLTLRSSPRVPFPAAVVVVGFVIAGLSLLLLVYSLFIEIPVFSRPSSGAAPLTLVTRGTYALCRHPGVLWLAAAVAGGFLATGALFLAIAFVVWVGCDCLLVYAQEKLFFPKMFGPAYREYQRDVPMLIPSAGSIARCIQSFTAGGRRR